MDLCRVCNEIGCTKSHKPEPYVNEECRRNCHCHSCKGFFHCFSGPCCKDQNKITNPVILAKTAEIVKACETADSERILKLAKELMIMQKEIYLD